MFILLDGPDRVGKDTLARKLISHFHDHIFLNLHTIHIDGYDREKYYAWYEYIFTLGLHHSVILNRTHLSEYVFGRLYRRYDSSGIFEVEKIIKGKDDVFLFLLVDDIDNLLKREDGRSIYSNAKEKALELQAFEDGYNKSSIVKKHSINIRDKSPDEVFDIVIKAMG